jgi:transcriptional regulator with XRE-family HTH domain
VCSKMETIVPRQHEQSPRAGAKAFGTYLRMLRENCYGKGKGKSLRQLARESGISPSVLSRGERGIQDLRKPEYIERLAPHLGVNPSVMKRVASLITSEDIEYFRAINRNFGAGAIDMKGNGASIVLWTKLNREIQKLRAASPETLETLLTFVEFLIAREGLGKDARSER